MIGEIGASPQATGHVYIGLNVEFLTDVESTDLRGSCSVLLIWLNVGFTEVVPTSVVVVVVGHVDDGLLRPVRVVPH